MKQGDSNFDEGSEGNAVARILKMYGVAPENEHTGELNGRKFYTYAKMIGFTIHKDAIKDILSRFN